MKKITWLRLFALILLGIGQVSFAQSSFFDNYVYQMWNSLGTLTGTTANDIMQTKDGYINIATYEGLVRFDGMSFTTLRRSKENEYSFISVRTMLEDSRGSFWICSNDEGVQKISQEGNKTYTMQNGLPNNSVRAIEEDQKGNIWVGTAAGVVYLTQDGKLLTPQFQAGTVSKGIITKNLYCDTAGRIWLLTANEKGLFLYSDGIFRTLDELESYGTYFATAIAQDLTGSFWIGLGEKGLLRITNGIVSPVETGTLLDYTPTWAIHTDSDGTMWFGTEKGLVVYSNGSFFEYKKGDLGSANINKIIRDREGNIWIATDRNGIMKLTHGKFKVTKLNRTVNAIAEGLDGKIWVGADNGVRCYENEHEITNTLTRFTEGLRIRHIQTAENGDILVCCYTKPAQIRYSVSKDTIQTWSTDDGLCGNKVRVAIETTPGELYVGTTTGLSIIHSDGSINNLKQIDGLDNEYVMCIYKDSHGIVWVGSDGGGIYLVKDEKVFSNITSEDGLAGNVVFKISQDKEGAYWICTGGGISRIPPFDSASTEPPAFGNVNSEHGIGTDSVFQLIPDTSGETWMTSNYGISSVSTSELAEAALGSKEQITSQFYNRNDGLDSDGPTSTALSICDRHGRLWFTLVDGFAVYDPIKIHSNPVMPLVCIESVVVDNVQQRTNGTIILRPGTKRVEIKFTGLSFDAPERITFTHQLTGFEDEFSTPNSQRITTYTNLKPGRHTFLVNAINGDGLFSEQAKTMLFVQKPYFYQVPLFWVLVAIIFIGSVVLIFYVKSRRMRLENIRLEKMVQNRTAELEEEKNRSDNLLRAILPDKIADELRGNIHSIGENFNDATLLFSDIVGFTKVSSGHTAAEIVNALNDLFSRFDDRAKRSGVEKIKTIGDAYMAACGIPAANPDHARIMVNFAKGMYEDLAEYNKTANIQFNIRIGLNCGPVTAGVIGKTKFIYDVWGNTVNVASRMETACTPGHIRVTQAVKDHLNESGIQFSEPIECDIKGKGLMTTYEVV